jgi:hypothetical protein
MQVLTTDYLPPSQIRENYPLHHAATAGGAASAERAAISNAEIAAITDAKIAAAAAPASSHVSSSPLGSSCPLITRLCSGQPVAASEDALTPLLQRQLGIVSVMYGIVTWSWCLCLFQTFRRATSLPSSRALVSHVSRGRHWCRFRRRIHLGAVRLLAVACWARGCARRSAARMCRTCQGHRESAPVRQWQDRGEMPNGDDMDIFV